MRDCNNCRFEHYAADEIPCIACGIDEREQWQPKPKTNADRIRAMSDEELAKLIVKQLPMYLWPNGVRTIYFDMDNHNKDNAVKAWLKWLQRPAEET